MEKPNINRRKAPDKWVQISRALALFSWAFFIAAIILSYYAAPEDNFGFLSANDIQRRDHWVMPLTNYLYLILWFSALASFFCLLVTKFRSRRRDDSKQFNIILLLCSIAAWLAYIVTHI